MPPKNRGPLRVAAEDMQAIAEHVVDRLTSENPGLLSGVVREETCKARVAGLEGLLKYVRTVSTIEAVGVLITLLGVAGVLLQLTRAAGLP